MTRSKKSFGTTRRLASGRWQARYQDLDGLRRAAPLTFASRVDAERWLSNTERDLLDRKWIDPDGGTVLLDQWAPRWLKSRVDLKPTTQASYESLMRNHIIPAFGRRQIARIRPTDVQEWVAHLSNEGRSSSQVRQLSNLLGVMLKSAVADGLIPNNPCESVRLPRARHREVNFFTAAQIEDLAAAIRSPYHVLIYVLAYGGLRYGEASALRRNDSELARGRLRIDESLAEVNGHLHFGTTKTHQTRFVTLPPFLCELVARHLDERVGLEPEALVFTSPQGQPLRYGAFYRRSWLPALRAAGLPPSGMHSLRHTCASLLIAHGAPIKAVQAQLGHQSAELTLDRYGHLYPDQMDILAERLEEARRHARSPAGRTRVNDRTE